MTIRAVLFDLDNTLFDHLTFASTGLVAFLRHLGVEHSGTLMHRWFRCCKDPVRTIAASTTSAVNTRVKTPREI